MPAKTKRNSKLFFPSLPKMPCSGKPEFWYEKVVRLPPNKSKERTVYQINDVVNGNFQASMQSDKLLPYR
jgi:hypothetical protein